MRKKLLAVCLTVAAIAGPATAYASIGPKSLSYCDIAKWIGVTYVMACEGV